METKSGKRFVVALIATVFLIFFAQIFFHMDNKVQEEIAYEQQEANSVDGGTATDKNVSSVEWFFRLVLVLIFWILLIIKVMLISMLPLLLFQFLKIESNESKKRYIVMVVSSIVILIGFLISIPYLFYIMHGKEISSEVYLTVVGITLVISMIFYSAIIAAYIEMRK